MVVLIPTLWRSLIAAVLLVCALPLEQCSMKPAACGASLMLSSQCGSRVYSIFFYFFLTAKGTGSLPEVGKVLRSTNNKTKTTK